MRQMSDLISRQDAIDALEGEVTVTGRANAEAVRGYANLICDRIKQLPSAQPEIIRCCQCKYAEVADKEDSQDGYTCQFHRGSIWFSGSYCSWAERRTDG